VLRAQAQSDQRERIDFPIIEQLLVRLVALECVHRVITPLPIYIAFEITSVGERLLDLLIPLGVRMSLIARP
jgi:hypothetical protein